MCQRLCAGALGCWARRLRCAPGHQMQYVRAAPVGIMLLLSVPRLLLEHSVCGLAAPYSSSQSHALRSAYAETLSKHFGMLIQTAARQACSIPSHAPGYPPYSCLLR